MAGLEDPPLLHLQRRVVKADNMDALRSAIGRHTVATPGREVVVEISFELSQRWLKEFASSSLGQATTELSLRGQEEEENNDGDQEQEGKNICFSEVDLPGMPRLARLNASGQKLLAVNFTKERYPLLKHISIDQNRVDGDTQICYWNTDLPELLSVYIERITLDDPGGRWDRHAGPPEYFGNFGLSLSRSPKLQSLNTYKCWGLGVDFRSQALTLILPSCTSLTFYRSDDLDHMVLWAPRLQSLDLEAVYRLQTVRILNTIPMALRDQFEAGAEALSYSTTNLDLLEGVAFERALNVESPFADLWIVVDEVLQLVFPFLATYDLARCASPCSRTWLGLAIQAAKSNDLLEGAAFEKAVSVQSPFAGGVVARDAVNQVLQLVLPFMATLDLARCIAPCGKPVLALVISDVKARPRRQSLYNVNVANTRFGLFAEFESNDDDDDDGDGGDVPVMEGGNLFTHPRLDSINREMRGFDDVSFFEGGGEWNGWGDPGEYPAPGVEDEDIAVSLAEDYAIPYAVFQSFTQHAVDEPDMEEDSDSDFDSDEENY